MSISLYTQNRPNVKAQFVETHKKGFVNHQFAPQRGVRQLSVVYPNGRAVAHPYVANRMMWCRDTQRGVRHQLLCTCGGAS